MKIKNIILLIFVLFALNSFYQPVQISSVRYKHTIVRQINFSEDNLTGELIRKKETYLFRELISIKTELMMTERFYEANDTS